MMRPVPPGEVLQEQLEELGMSASKLAALLDVPPNRITGILNAQRSLTAETAIRLSKFFGTSAEFWLALQSNYDLRKAELESSPGAKVISLADFKTARSRSPKPLRVASSVGYLAPAYMAADRPKKARGKKAKKSATKKASPKKRRAKKA